MKIHLIAIGGSAMHNLAVALKRRGHEVSGSDDEIFEPSKSRLAAEGILPPAWGWFPDKIAEDLDAVILGMHAREDNPELIAALDAGIKIYSYPEYLYEQTKNKTRIVVGGSHGKTTVTSIIMHVLEKNGRKFDYMAGAGVRGFDTMVRLEETNPIAVFEGDEYLSSAIDRRPKFHHYRPHIAILTGIAWDHINVFPTFENYVEQFKIFIDKIEVGGKLIYYKHDPHIQKLLTSVRKDISLIGYEEFPNRKTGNLRIIEKGGNVPVSIFGKHNMENLSAAYWACKEAGISEEEFFAAASSFKGADKRLEKILESGTTEVFMDFAHSPSKLKASIAALREEFPGHRIIACMELHTFSSLNADFLPTYRNSMQEADSAYVYYNPEVISRKKLPDISTEKVKKGFNRKDLNVYTDNRLLFEMLGKEIYENAVLIFMSSGNFSGTDLRSKAKELVG